MVGGGRDAEVRRYETRSTRVTQGWRGRTYEEGSDPSGRECGNRWLRRIIEDGPREKRLRKVPRKPATAGQGRKDKRLDRPTRPRRFAGPSSSRLKDRIGRGKISSAPKEGQGRHDDYGVVFVGDSGGSMRLNEQVACRSGLGNWGPRVRGGTGAGVCPGEGVMSSYGHPGAAAGFTTGPPFQWGHRHCRRISTYVSNLSTSAQPLHRHRPPAVAVWPSVLPLANEGQS